MDSAKIPIINGAVLTLVFTVAAGGDGRLAGLPVAEALRALQARGLVVVYSTALVTDEMLVANEPLESEPAAIAMEILLPHGLTLDEGPDRQFVVVKRLSEDRHHAPSGRIVGRIERGDRGPPDSQIQISLDELARLTPVRPDGSFEFSGVPAGSYTLRATASPTGLPAIVEVKVEAGRATPVVMTLGSPSVFLNEIIITPSHFRILDQEPENRVFLDHDQVAQMPHVADDLFRAVKRLPGTAGGDYSAQFNVRGGEQEEVLVLCDEDDKEFSADFFIDECTFLTSGSNPYWVLEPWYELVLEGEDDGEEVGVTITVLEETYEVDGVETRVGQEFETADGETVEISRNYFAICEQTNSVFYFGEHVDIYEDGEVVSHDGEWLAGVDGAEAGIIMPGTVLLGSRYMQEVAPDVAMDRAEHVGEGLDIETEAGSFEDCIRIDETSPLEPGQVSVKYYCRGIGLVIDSEVELVSYSK